jgi:major membrane immunogen (membrane-anchored lipoprotein)
MLFTMKIFLIAGFMLCACSIFAQTTSVTTTQETKQVVEREKDGKKWKLTLKNYEVEQLTLNGKIVSTKEYAKYQNVIDALRATANGYEMPFEVVEPTVTAKGIASKQYEYTESYTLTPEQKYVNWKIEEELKNDKILGDNGKSFQFELTEKSLIINGKEQPKALLDKYVDIYYNYSGEQRCNGCIFRLSFNRQAEKSAGW